VKFSKNGVMKFVGHLDMMRYFQKAMRRADIPVALTKGYNPHMIMSFASPLGVGLTSDGEYFDVTLSKVVSLEEAMGRLNETMAEGIGIINMVELEAKQKTGMAVVAAADYLVFISPMRCSDELKERVVQFMSQDRIMICKKTKKSEREVDIKPMICRMEVQRDKGSADVIFLRVATGSAENLKPELVMQAFAEFYSTSSEQVIEFTRQCSYHRLEVYAEGLTPLDQFGVQ